jgi:hypothetical protein
MKRLGFVLLALLVVLAAFWIGLMATFPGVAVSRYVERQVNGRQAFDLVLTPAELRWNRLRIARAELRRRDNPAAEPLLVVSEFVIPITWRMVQGLPAEGRVGGDGLLEVFLPWGLGGEARLDGEAKLETLPLPAVFKPITLGGRLRVQGRFVMDAEARAGKQLPDGTLEATVQDLVVDGVQVGGADLPSTRLESLVLTVETGRMFTVRRLEYRGDIQGSGQGTITPNLRDPRNTQLSVRISASFRDTWLAQLGTLRPILESFLNRGRVVLGLTGTVGRPNLQPVQGAN